MHSSPCQNTTMDPSNTSVKWTHVHGAGQHSAINIQDMKTLLMLHSLPKLRPQASLLQQQNKLQRHAHPSPQYLGPQCTAQRPHHLIGLPVLHPCTIAAPLHNPYNHTVHPTTHCNGSTPRRQTAGHNCRCPQESDKVQSVEDMSVGTQTGYSACNLLYTGLSTTTRACPHPSSYTH
jgi:hypothetical protein